MSKKRSCARAWYTHLGLLCLIAGGVSAQACSSSKPDPIGPCEAKRDLFANCKKQPITSEQLASCKSTLSSRNCSASEFDAYAKYFECMSDKCTGGKSEKDADEACFENLFSLRTSSLCNGP